MKLPDWYVYVSVAVATAFFSLLLIASFLVILPPQVDLEEGPKNTDDSISFSGIKDNDSVHKNKNVIIVHGIGTHCLGYADQLVANIRREMKSSSLDDDGFYKVKSGCERYGNESSYYDLLLQKMSLECELIHDGRLAAINNPLSLLKNQDVNESDRLSEYDVNANFEYTKCFQIDLSARDVWRLDQPREKKVTIGFVRVAESALESGKILRIFEVTWSPAAQWAKDPLAKVQDIYQSRGFGSALNQKVKGGVVDSAIADAVAYLGRSGILVNYTVLQALCVMLSDIRLAPYSAKCAEPDLRGGKDFYKDNDVYFVTHSLGTRVLFDTLGMLSTGINDEQQELGIVPKDKTERARSGRPISKLVTKFYTEFEKIGVVAERSEEDEFDYSSADYSDAVNVGVEGVVKSIKSIFVFTNQIPLLYAHMSSPFLGRSEDIGEDFAGFLKKRVLSGETSPLEVVSFHDEDDLLSYDLQCWYQETVLKEDARVNEKIFEFSKQYGSYFDDRADPPVQESCEDDGCEQGMRHYLLREKIGEVGCFRNEFVKSSSDEFPLIKLYDDIWGQEQNVHFYGVEVFMNGFRVPRLFAYPHHVHSNYFQSKKLASVLVGGLVKY
jgi:hypothetical protein